MKDKADDINAEKVSETAEAMYVLHRGELCTLVKLCSLRCCLTIPDTRIRKFGIQMGQKVVNENLISTNAFKNHILTHWIIVVRIGMLGKRT